MVVWVKLKGPGVTDLTAEVDMIVEEEEACRSLPK
jgi:hypothetical protein